MKSERFAKIGFTLVELLVVIGIIGVLAALLLTVLVKAKAYSRSTVCKNHLHQMGLALQSYVNDHENKYPSYQTRRDTSLDGESRSQPLVSWWEQLTPYYALKWTDVKYHCPGYHGAIAAGFPNNYSPPPYHGPPYGSYAYNANGVSMAGFGKPYDPDLGLGFVGPGMRVNSEPVGRAPFPETQIKAPSAMLAIGESRFLNAEVNRSPGGSDLLTCGLLNWRGPNGSELFDLARHGKNYNLLFCDGHVTAMAPQVLFNPTNTATMWNRDQQPHPELWVP